MRSTALETGTATHSAGFPFHVRPLGAFGDPQIPFGETISLAAGATLYHEEDEALYLYKVIEGAIRAFTHTEDGRRQINGFYFRGDSFGTGQMGLYRSSTEAISECTLIRYRRRKSPGEVDPSFDQLAFEVTLSEIRCAEQQILLLGRMSACSKVAAFLFYLATRLVGDLSAKTVIHVPMTRYDIADFLGLSAESVSRCLTRLKQRGRIEMASPEEIVLGDLEALLDIPRGF